MIYLRYETKEDLNQFIRFFNDPFSNEFVKDGILFTNDFFREVDYKKVLLNGFEYSVKVDIISGLLAVRSSFDKRYDQDEFEINDIYR